MPATKTKPATSAPAVVVYDPSYKPNSDRQYSAFRFTHELEDGSKVIIPLRPGQPVLLAADEFAALKGKLSSDQSYIRMLNITREHAVQLLEQFADAERDGQAKQLRTTVARLVQELKSTGMYTQPAIDELLAEVRP